MEVILNWKQNGSFAIIEEFVKNVKTKNENVSLLLPFPYIAFAQNLCLTSKAKIKIGAQNVSQFQNGAYTGEVGVEMLAELKVKECLVGHSERRSLFFEDDLSVKSKVELLTQKGITPILCVGETHEERTSKSFFEKLKKQMVSYNEKCIIAYEPVWSIGTGITPTSAEILEISNFIYENWGNKILYGGSVNESNFESIIKIKNIRGVLVGGASLFVEKVNLMLNLC